MQYKSAKEIWDKIVLSYEGDEQVKRAKGIRTPNNLYIFEEGQQQCYLSKNDEH